jgi:hypothetical protein
MLVAVVIVLACALVLALWIGAGVRDAAARHPPVSAARALDVSMAVRSNTASGDVSTMPVVADRVAVAPKVRFSCRFADGVPVTAGTVISDGARIGSITEPGVAELSAEAFGDALEIEVASDARLPVKRVKDTLIAARGFFVRGSLRESDLDDSGALIVLRGRIGVRDQADFEEARAAGAATALPEALRTYSVIRRMSSTSDGALGPLLVPMIDDDEAFDFVVVARHGALRQHLHGIRGYGEFVDLGVAKLEPVARMNVIVDNAADLDLELLLARVPDSAPAGDELLGWVERDHHLAIRGGVALPVPANHMLEMGPLDAGRIEARLRMRNGSTSPPFRAELVSGETTTLRIDASVLASSPRLAVAVLREPDLAPIAGARVIVQDPTGALSVRGDTDFAGQCSLAFPLTESNEGELGAPPGEWILVVEAFDKDVRERRFLSTVDAGSWATRRIRVTIPSLATLRAHSLNVPPAAPRSVPLGYRLERALPGQSFELAAVEEFTVDGDAVTAKFVAEEALYRIVAIYSAVYEFESEPVAILASENDAVTSFAALSAPIRYLRGSIVDSHGVALRDVAVEATTGGGVPPELVFTDERGRFTVGPIVAATVEIHARGVSTIARAPFADDVILISVVGREP